MLTWTYCVLPSTVCHAYWRKTNVMIAWRFVVTYQYCWQWSGVSQQDHNWRRNVVFPVRSATKATIRHLENASVKGKVMLELFFDSNRIFHMEFIPEAATLNKTRFKEILGRLHDSILRKRPERWRRKNWMLLPDTPLHIALSLSKRNLQSNMSPFCHTPYSPDLAPCDFLYFSRMKALLRRCRFQLTEEVMTATREAVSTAVEQAIACVPVK